MSSDEPEFLDVEDVIEIHATQLEVYGGAAGLRDRGLLESAVAQPQASLGGEFAHGGLFEMAAAYLFHIVSNHPFVDGNKRTGVLAAVVFLDVNGISIDHPSEALYELTMGVAEGRIEKAAVAVELERIAKSKGT
ncbi:type II toxin-antitoxin system death-on-curing family toxin [Archangium violaceum]|uniref:type II toxin-antitoxin system death-on-curing family toxin n=1 Tax=Archangium violaceum TaxID=83451 RepID=UPI00193B697D|nr:type II toxin-antitoxin system death-on-curing family toxin [Archangium violaceum]QRK08586.1 type II toxin-antitoxin system death-on-curing family toxin [Archangium violaceum]